MATSNLDKFVRGRLPDLPESRERYYQDEFRKLERQAATAYDKFTLTDRNIAGVSAELSVERTVRANADSALAVQITNLTTTVGQNTVAVEEAIESVDGVKGRYGVTINNNGHISGISLLSDASNGNPTSVFRVAANQFAVRSPGASTDSLFWDSGAAKLTIRGDLALRTSDSGARIEINSSNNRLTAYSSTGANTVEIGGNTGSVYATATSTAAALYGDGSSTNRGVDARSGSIYDAVYAQAYGTASSNNAVYGTNFGKAVSTAGIVGAGNGYDFYAAGGGTNYGPFTGAHDGLIAKGAVTEMGDIVGDVQLVRRKNVSNTIFEVGLSGQPNKAALGVVASDPVPLSDREPAALVDEIDQQAGLNVMAAEYAAATGLYNLISVNAVGEGQINVCGENGNIQAGDLIVTSSIPGKGMKQADDIVRSYTVAKARESVSFASPTEVKQIACIYLCG